MNRHLCAVALCLGVLGAPGSLCADGKMVPPVEYEGSLEETAQEAIIIFTNKDGVGVEDMILKVSVAQAPENFGWVIPFPTPPEIEKADERLFNQLYKYVERQLQYKARQKEKKMILVGAKTESKDAGVEVLARKTVGAYETAIVREETSGALNKWLADNGFQTLEGGEDVIEYYRALGFVFACIKVSGQTLKFKEVADLHPLRFRFKTGGRDGIYFPMKMTGLQTEPFDVNLYVFYKSWLNDSLNRYGFTDRGFSLKYRDWDCEKCEPNAGRSWDTPEEDRVIKHGGSTNSLSQIRALFQDSYSWERFYLTNIQAFGVRPEEVRNWSGDLWLFPHYTDLEMIPYDARIGGPANIIYQTPGDDVRDVDQVVSDETRKGWLRYGAAVGFMCAVLCLVLVLRRKKNG
jgi:hypothetical protein